MSLSKSSARSVGSLSLSDRAEIIARYKCLRAVGLNLNNKLVRTLSKSVMDEGGTKLGMLRHGILYFDNEDQSSVLMDYCIYNVRRNGRNAVEQYLIDTPPSADSDEMTCLRAMQHAVYSLLVVQSVERGLGAIVLDAMANESRLIVDMGLSQSAQPGLLLATRVLSHEGFSMTGGAALPLGVLPEDREEEFLNTFKEALFVDDGGEVDPAELIRTLLKNGGSSRIAYLEPGAEMKKRRIVGRRALKTGRNRPCSCGSGLKYKHCCMPQR